MHCIKQVRDNLWWVGGNDRRIPLFEGVYSVPKGVSYNAYLLLDDQTVLFDTVDKALRERFCENLEEALGGRPLDYLVLQHLEPDHSAAILDVLARYPDVTIVANQKSSDFVDQFFTLRDGVKRLIVKENDTLATGKHTLRFLMASMVHWPEVMVTYDETSRTLFSADAFGCFGALDGAIFADEVNFARDYLDETRRYYTNIVGKYGVQTQALLKKAAGLEIEMICPLHGFVWRKNLSEIIAPHQMWSSYRPEEAGVMIAYASIYGNTENAAEILACRLRDRGIKTVVYDVAITPASEIVAAAFRWSHLCFASTTYNNGIFVTMEALIYDLAAHNIQNREVALIENGSWSASSGKLMREKLSQCKDMRFIGEVSLKSSVKPDKHSELLALAEAIAATFPQSGSAPPVSGAPAILDGKALRKIPYGLFLLTAKDGDKHNGCIVNTVEQVASSPLQISVAVSKENFTHDMILKTGQLAASVLSQAAPFSLFEHFGFTSGRTINKLGQNPHPWAAGLTLMDNGLYALKDDCATAIISGKVVSTTDCGTHTVFIAEVTGAQAAGSQPSCTYDYYFANIKPKPGPPASQGKPGHVCKICGYVYEGDPLPADFICPLCKHGADDFEKI
ncbi:MAG: flavin reductase [Oscillospiraceae bacterium]|nr:flavin reductase [Oscillospiraceae bacterium]